MDPKKVKAVIRHLAGAKVVHQGSCRLGAGFSSEKSALDYARLARELGNADPGHSFLLDTSFFARHEIDQCVWDALFRGRVFLTRHVWTELDAWLKTPYSNGHVVERFRRATGQTDHSIVLDHELAWEPDLYCTRSYYSSLLSVRRQRSRQIIGDFESEHGRSPTNEEANRLFQINGTERDFQLLKKGFADFGKPHFFTDDDLVSCAAVLGLRTGRPVTILTRDGDVLDQFQKLMTLLTSHYQALLFADVYANSPSSFQTISMPSTSTLESYFDCGQSLLVKKPVDPDKFVEWLLPQDYQAVRLTCVLLAGDPPSMTLQLIRFQAEIDMLRLIRTKGLAGGRSTNRLGVRNCHVTGFPEGIDDPRSWVVIATDRTESFRGTTFNVARLDLRHVIEQREIFTTRRQP
jgi:hypothetical protein